MTDGSGKLRVIRITQKIGPGQNVYDLYGKDQGWEKLDVRKNREVGTAGVKCMHKRAGRTHEFKTHTDRNFCRNLINDSCKMMDMDI